MRIARLCPCGSGLVGKSQWSQGIGPKVNCAKCFVQAPQKQPDARKPSEEIIRNAKARRLLEERQDLDADPLLR